MRRGQHAGDGGGFDAIQIAGPGSGEAHVRRPSYERLNPSEILKYPFVCDSDCCSPRNSNKSVIQSHLLHLFVNRCLGTLRSETICYHQSATKGQQPTLKSMQQVDRVLKKTCDARNGLEKRMYIDVCFKDRKGVAPARLHQRKATMARKGFQERGKAVQSRSLLN